MSFKYLCITPFFPSESNCEGIFIYDQISEIKKQTNFDVIVIKLSNYYNKELSYTYNEFKVHIFNLYDFPSFTLAGIFSRSNGKRFYNFLNSIINVNLVKYVHGHVNYPAGFLISYLKKHLSFISIIQHHGLDVFQEKHFGFLTKFYYKRYFLPKSIFFQNNTDLVVGVSKKVLDYLKIHENYRPKREIILYNGVDLNKFHKINLTKDKKYFVIGCIGNFWKSKGQKILVDAIKILNKQGFTDIKVVFVGKGDELNNIKKYVFQVSLQNCISFINYIKNEDLNYFYNSINLFVLPSYYEALGCVYLESWATETPFIGVSRQGIEELLNNKQKKMMISKEKDPIDLSNKILFFYNNRLEKIKFLEKLNIKETVKLFLNKLKNV